MKAWEIIAWDHDGERLCVGCANDCWGASKLANDGWTREHEISPVFAVDEDWGTCGGCLEEV